MQTADQRSNEATEQAAAQRAEALESSNAAETRSFDATLVANLIAAREVRNELPLLGLTKAQLEALFARHFPAANLTSLSKAPAFIEIKDASKAEFTSAMHALLLEEANKTTDPTDTDCLATIIAHACLRPDHLWRDLGLPGREAVTAMLDRYFPSIAARNTHNLRWKKFLAMELALKQGKEPGPAPGCPGCEDYTFCFPPAQ